MRACVWIFLTLLVCWCVGGCSSPAQPYLSESQLDRGYVLVLTGIEGRSRFNEAIADGLTSGGCPYAIEIYDWTSRGGPLLNQMASRRNQEKADEIARRVVRYQMAYPNRPVILVGQSGGAAMAIWTAERMGGRSVDGIVLIASSMSPAYRLDRALEASRRGVVNFYSERDVFLLGFGTAVFRTMDGSHSKSAGMVGFEVPEPAPSDYDHLFQVPFQSGMAATGHVGLHFTSGSEGFVREYVAPMVLTSPWSQKKLDTIINNAMERTNIK